MNKLFVEALNELATHVAKKAADVKTPLEESAEALKALTAYYALLLKQRGAGQDDNNLPNFADFKADLEAAKEIPNGATFVPGRRRRGRSDWKQPTDWAKTDGFSS